MKMSSTTATSRAFSRRRAGSTVLAALAIAVCSTTAVACTGAYPGGNADLIIDTWDDTAPDVLISSWAPAGNANFLYGCSPGTPTSVIVTPAMPDLIFERHVTLGGGIFPAYSVAGRPRSPLLVFQYLIGNGSEARTEPFNAKQPLSSPGTGITGGFRWSTLQVAAVSRGGEMQGLPTTVVGSATHAYRADPSLSKTESFSVTANLRTKTCTLSDTTVTLKSVSAGDLPSAGSDAQTQTFTVAMSCNGAFPLTLTLVDANAPGNTTSLLTPTSAADAQGVCVQLLREGVPVVLGQSWALAQGQAGPQDITLGARYYRQAGSFGPGVVQGQATLTATYR